MKTTILITVLSFFCISAHAGEIEKSEPMLWENLYQGNFSLSHKMVLSRQTKSTNDQLMSQFMMAYLFYRMGDSDKCQGVMEGIDNYLEYHYFQNSGQ